jgi:hypothetical protein
MRVLIVITLVLALGCGHVAPPNKITCSGELPTAAIGDPARLSDLILAIRTSDSSDPVLCEEGICVSPCEENSNCGRCDATLTKALYELGRLGSDDAAIVASSLVLNERMKWDGGLALTAADSFSRLGALILPYLKSHTSKSSLAATIVSCIESGQRRCL